MESRHRGQLPFERSGTVTSRANISVDNSYKRRAHVQNWYRTPRSATMADIPDSSPDVVIVEPAKPSEPPKKQAALTAFFVPLPKSAKIAGGSQIESRAPVLPIKRSAAKVKAKQGRPPKPVFADHYTPAESAVMAALPVKVLNVKLSVLPSQNVLVTVFVLPE